MRSLAIPLLMVLAASIRAQQTPAPDFRQRFIALSRQTGLSDSARLQRLFDLDWEFTMREFPDFATAVGYPGQNARWTDNTPTSIARRRAVVRAESLVVASIARARLRPADQLSYDIFRRRVLETLEGFRFPGELLAITKLNGPQYLSDILALQPSSTARDYEDILTRLAAIPVVLERTRALLDSGLVVGVTPPRVTLQNVPEQVRGLTPSDAMKSPLLEPFTRMPASIPEPDRSRIANRATELYAATLRPAFQRFHDYLTGTYLPRARTTLAMSEMPDGRAWYAYNVKVQTTTRRTPREIHDLGLSEVKRIRAQMDSIIRVTGFTGTFADFVRFLRTDPRFYYTDSASLVRAYRDIAKRIDPELPKLFGRLPRLTYGISTIPSYAAPSQTTAYYQQGSPEARRSGQFFVNTYKLDTRPMWEMEALTIHEAVPGHHLQIALGQEIEGIPEFRKQSGYTAFVEGWGLYSESLGDALGLYKDPYSRFGQLTYEMWRAIRLVLDTGIHAFGWTREQAIQYFTENSAKSAQDIEVEVDRYISWPGQALAYKSGELAIQALRRDAERELADRFEIRAFHDELLGQGALPLDVLEARMHAWVAAQKRKMN